MLLISNISKKFRGRALFDDVSLRAERGEAALLTGANGSGKTTLLRIAAGILPPDSGNLRLYETECHGGYSSRAYRGLAGYVSSDENSFYGMLTAAQNLDFFARLRGLDKTPADILARAEMLGASGYLDTGFSFLSKGTKQKFSFLRAFMGDPKAIFADETDAMDAASQKTADNMLAEFAGDGGILLCVGKTRVALASKQYLIENGRLAECY
jgi:ABC-type multidrug transport system ATPase subunit